MSISDWILRRVEDMFRCNDRVETLVVVSPAAVQVMKHMKISASLDKGTPNMEKWPLAGIMNFRA